jgi:hypothetical protein
MDVPWINKLVSVITCALQMPHIKIIGVCFGHQIIGRALNAPVQLNYLGWETAVLPVDLAPAGKVLFGKDQLVRMILFLGVSAIILIVHMYRTSNSHTKISSPRVRRVSRTLALRSAVLCRECTNAAISSPSKAIQSSMKR